MPGVTPHRTLGTFAGARQYPLRRRRRRGWQCILLPIVSTCLVVLVILFATRSNIWHYKGDDRSDQAQATDFTLAFGNDDDPDGRRPQGGAQARDITVVVMPSPPMVSGPMTRLDRLTTIADTWGRDLLEGSTSRHRVMFVLDEGDAAIAGLRSRRDWEHVRGDEPSFEGKSGKGRTPRVLIVPASVSGGGKDGDARMRHVLRVAASAYEPSFLFYCNEHTFVIAENLQHFVSNLDPLDPAYLGNRFRKKDGQGGQPMLNSGAAGFVLTRGSLALLRRAWASSESGTESSTLGSPGKCSAKSEFERGNPGVTLARCLQHVGVEAVDTTDDQGGQRFNAYGPVRLANGRIDQWYKDVHASDPGMWRAGPACCSADMVSFHYVGPAEARAMHQILHEKRSFDSPEAVYDIWPSSQEDLGAYSSLMRADDSLTYGLLVEKIRLFGSA